MAAFAQCMQSECRVQEATSSWTSYACIEWTSTNMQSFARTARISDVVIDMPTALHMAPGAMAGYDEQSDKLA